jgi:hypothetical protein
MKPNPFVGLNHIDGADGHDVLRADVENVGQCASPRIVRAEDTAVCRLSQRSNPLMNRCTGSVACVRFASAWEIWRMTIRLVSEVSNVVRFPGGRQERPSIELATRLAPARSLVDTLIAERGDTPHDAQAGFAREFAYQARALEAGHGRDETIIRLRALVDAHVAHATEICRDYQAVADRLIALEVQVAKAERITAPTLISLRAARAELQGRAIAARAATDGALGAVAALAAYVKEGLSGSAVSETESRQLLLFAAATG